ncbi:bifunctional triacylglycerol lipase/ester hydrolase, partial [Aspergillus aculeatinus CBS 121060]
MHDSELFSVSLNPDSGAMSPEIDPHMTPDSFFHTLCDKKSSGSVSGSPVIIYFISGNPGLISYYYPFFTHLIEKLRAWSSEDDANPRFHLYGHSLAGFEVASSPSDSNTEHYHDLEDQIRFVQRKLDDCVSRVVASETSAFSRVNGDTIRPRVILIGHSVGTYIAMELIRRHRERSSSSSSSLIDTNPSFPIISAILLFPTVVDIAKSPSGRKLTTLLTILPHLALIASLVARVLTTLLPGSMLRTVVRLVMGSPPSAAVDTTCRFLTSRRGVRQALHMAASEMYTINSDEWADEVWGIASTPEAAKSLTKLFFYYGRGDHWVAEETREEIIALRGRGNGNGNGNANGITEGGSAKGGEGEGEGGRGPTMVVCEEGLPHAFCLRHSEVMAEKVAGMVREVV